ncbi:MAG TPA: glycosyltransferase family 39 protein [Roseiflexaceae bacterium]|nr:glycosyltransferase family 39 protein [Roseiflexaceae bacterium]
MNIHPASYSAATAGRFPPSIYRHAALLIGIVGLLLRLAFALLPLDAHLILLEDDAWMVTAIARNAALGLGITADGINPTTGFQPLHPLTIGTLPFLIAPDALDAGFSASLALCALLASLACWPLWSLARRLGGDHAGLIAVTLYALNPTIIRLTINGMETALGLLLLLTLFAAFYALDLRRLPQILLLALLTALAILARLDASLAFAAISATLGLQLLQVAQAAPGSLRDRLAGMLPGLGRLVSYCAVTLLLLLPYFSFNYIIGGRIGPSSGAALAFMQSYRGSFYLTNGLSAFYQNSAIYLDWLPSLWFKLILVIGAVIGLLRLLGRRLGQALPLLLFIPVPPLYYGYYLQQIRERYFVGLSAILIILLAWAAAECLRRRPTRSSVAAISGTLLVIIGLNCYEAIGFYQRMRTHAELTQPTSYQAALWIRDNLPADALIGAKNSGIYQYYSGHTVLNIDGKLNHEILPMLEQRTLLDYLRRQSVEYLVDRENTMAHHVMFYSRQFGEAPYHRTPSLSERIAIYGRIAANTLGADLPLVLDDQRSFTPIRPFSDAAEIIARFERPNDSTNPVVVYRLKPTTEPGAP